MAGEGQNSRERRTPTGVTSPDRSLTATPVLGVLDQSDDRSQEADDRSRESTERSPESDQRPADSAAPATEGSGRSLRAPLRESVGTEFEIRSVTADLIGAEASLDAVVCADVTAEEATGLLARAQIGSCRVPIVFVSDPATEIPDTVLESEHVRWLVSGPGESPGATATRVVEAVEGCLARRREAFLRDVDRSTAEATIVTQSDGTVSYASTGVETVYGHDPAAVAGTSALEWVYPDDRESVLAAFAAACDGDSPTSVECRVERADGAMVWSEATILDYRTESVVDGVVCHVHDVDDRRAREELFSGLFAESTNGIAIHELVTDGDGEPVDYVFLDVNEAFEEYTGLGADRIVGKRATEVVPGIEETDFIETYGAVAQGGNSVRIERYSEPLDRHYDITCFSPRPGQFVTTFTDVTDRKLREGELERYELIVEAAGDPMYLLDEEGRFTFVNEAFSERSGYDEESLLGSHGTLVMTDDDLEKGTRLVGRLLASEDTRGTFRMDLQTADGERIPCENHVVLLPTEDGFAGTAGVIRDITERTERTQQLAVLDRLLRHNLRNDMNVIFGNAERIAETVDASIDSLVDEIEHVGENLLDLADKERQIAELVLNSPPNREMELTELVGRSVDRCRAQYPDAAVEVSLPSTAPVRTIPQIERAITELIENAITHSDREQPQVVLTGGACDERFELRVADHGPGIADQERTVLTGESEIDSVCHGSGTGLWLVKWIVTHSNGSLAFDENRPRGSVVTLTLPSGDPEAENAELG